MQFTIAPTLMNSLSRRSSSRRLSVTSEIDCNFVFTKENPLLGENQKLSFINSFRANDDRSKHSIALKCQSFTRLNDSIVCGVTGIKGKLDEDRFCILNDSNSEYFGFGVFDGHGGNYASEFLSQAFCLQVIQQYKYSLNRIKEMCKSMDSKVFNTSMLDSHGGGDI